METNYTTYLKQTTPNEKELISNCLERARLKQKHLRTNSQDQNSQVEKVTSFHTNRIPLFHGPVSLMLLCERTALKSLQCKAKPITAQEVLDGI